MTDNRIAVAVAHWRRDGLSVLLTYGVSHEDTMLVRIEDNDVIDILYFCVSVAVQLNNTYTGT